MVRSIWDRITNRILLGYSIPLLALLGLSVIVYDSTARTFQLQQQSDRIERQIRNVNGLVDGLNRMIGVTRAYVIYPGDQSANDAYADARRAFIDSANNAAAIADSQTRPSIEDLTQLGEEYDRTLQNVFRLIDENRAAQAREELRRPRIVDAVAQRDRVVSDLQNQLNQNNQVVQASQNFLLRLIVIGTGITILATLAAGLLVTLPLRPRSLLSRSPSSHPPLPSKPPNTSPIADT